MKRTQGFKLLGSVLLLSLLQTGCAEKINLETTVRWSRDGAAPPKPADLDKSTQPLVVGSKTIRLQKQKIDGVEIEDSFFKSISSQNQDEFITYKWAPNVPMRFRTQVLMMKSQKPFVVREFFKRYHPFSKKDLVGFPELVIRSQEPLWKIVLQKPNGELQGYYLNAHFKIVQTARVGSNFVTATATVFPRGPLKSQLQEVLLSELAETGTLTTPRVRITTQSDLPAVAEKNQFLFPVNDQRFKQVQTFFYLEQVLDWCESHFQFKLPFLLEAETAVGFPSATNTAFYYSHRIRLGDGDGDVFANIPLDPSIVMHESLHAVIEAVAGLPYEGEGGSLNEGFADFFTSQILKNPKLGEASYKKGLYKRTVENKLSFNDRDGGLYHDSGVFSGLFWELQQQLGEDVAQKWAWHVLLRLTPGSDFESARTEILETLEDLPISSREMARSILQQRGWIR